VLLLVCATLVTSAGACNREDGGPIPSPTAFGAGPIGEGDATSGIDALYVGRERPDCSELLRLMPDGTAHRSSVCTDDVTPYVEEPTRWLDQSNGDYAAGDGVLLVRVVTWDVITGAHQLDAETFVTCTTGLRDVPPEGSRRVPFRYDLVEGAGPPGGAVCPDD